MTLRIGVRMDTNRCVIPADFSFGTSQNNLTTENGTPITTENNILIVV